VTDDTIVCRCEDLTLTDIIKYIRDGYETLDELKRVSRCMMGPCQGKTCRDLVIQVLCQHLSKQPQELSMPTARPLTRPMTLGAIADGANHEE